jgi:hypothetical protein
MDWTLIIAITALVVGILAVVLGVVWALAAMGHDEDHERDLKLHTDDTFLHDTSSALRHSDFVYCKNCSCPTYFPAYLRGRSRDQWPEYVTVKKVVTYENFLTGEYLYYCGRCAPDYDRVEKRDDGTLSYEVKAPCECGCDAGIRWVALRTERPAIH